MISLCVFFSGGKLRCTERWLAASEEAAWPDDVTSYGLSFHR